ncbi:cytochrome c oxidase assembly protein [Gemmata sp.]|uniref:cytochrome c oxidase assembly protein n=1 Tax=Gemmata sp. TaxID=1914242 RepID=UPI003F6ECFD9
MTRRAATVRFALVPPAWAAASAVARAHGGGGEADGGPRDWHELAGAWPLEPLVVLPLLVTAWVYARGVRRLWREAGTGRGVRRWQAACFAGGWLALAVALASPLHPWGNVLFSVHMVQHELMMLVAAPLLVLGRPVVATLKALPPGRVRGLLRWTKPAPVQAAWALVTNLLVAWLLHAVVLWAWHVPALFGAALHSEFVHALQHLSFLLSAVLFWWAILHRGGGAAGYGAAVLYLFTTAAHSGFLGALITLAGVVWYPDYAGTTQAWGLTPLEDQQAGGLIMWVPACTVYIVAGLALFAGWLRASGERARPRRAVATAEVRP